MPWAIPCQFSSVTQSNLTLQPHGLQCAIPCRAMKFFHFALDSVKWYSDFEKQSALTIHIWYDSYSSSG